MGIVKATEHKIKAMAVAASKLWLRKRSERELVLDVASMKRVLFLRPEKIGDMMISFPVFDALLAKHPHLKLGLVASPRSISLVREDPRFEDVFIYEKGLPSVRRLIRQLREKKYDCILDMIDNDSATTLFLSQLIGRNVPRIGVGKEQHERYYDFNYRHDDGVGGHIIENTLGLLVPFGVDIDKAERYAAPYITRAAAKKADAAFENMEPGLRVGLNLSAGKPNRIWPTEKANDLANRLVLLRDDLRLILIVTPADRERGERVLSAINGEARLVPPGMGLLDVCALISQIDLLISPDTSLIHVARSFRIPVVGLYNDARKNFTRWRPYGQPDGAVVSSDIDSITDIPVEQVYERVVQIIEREHPVVS